MDPSLPPDLTLLNSLKSKVYQDEPQNLTELRRDGEREVRSISGGRAAKLSVMQRSEQSCPTKKVNFFSTCCSGGAVERGNAEPVARKSPKNVVSDDIIKLCL